MKPNVPRQWLTEADTQSYSLVICWIIIANGRIQSEICFLELQTANKKQIKTIWIISFYTYSQPQQCCMVKNVISISCNNTYSPIITNCCYNVSWLLFGQIHWNKNNKYCTTTINWSTQSCLIDPNVSEKHDKWYHHFKQLQCYWPQT